MNTAVINVKVEPVVKRNAQKLAEDLGLSLSGLVNGLLKQVIRTKTVTLSVSDEEPSEYLIQALKESREDIRAGRVTSFESIDDAKAYVDKLIAEDEAKADKRRLYK